MDGLQANEPGSLQLGEEWIQAVIEKDFQRLVGLCHPDMHGRLMTPRRFDALENAADVAGKIEKWFHECRSIQKEQARVAMVGEKLAIFYRLRTEENGTLYSIEQQIYCSLSDGRIDQLSLLCSGFQLARAPDGAATAEVANRAANVSPVPEQPLLQAQALLDFKVSGGQGSTCAILTPSIKRKLGEMSSGQVLEVHVDDPTAQEDIEAWCRLSQNRLLKIDRGVGQELRFYLMKK
jgi:TusA-related sulfurtransferase